MIEIDARGLSCPLPVVRVKNAMDGNSGDEIKVLIDTEETRENVTRMAENRGYAIVDETVDEDEEIILVLKPA